MATATWAATEALFSARARFAGTLRPSVASPMRPSTNGVIAAPVTPERSHSSSASRSTSVEVGGVEFGFDGNRHREQHARRRAGSGRRRCGPPRRPTRPDGERASRTSGCRTPGTSRAAIRGPVRLPSRGTPSVRGRSRNAFAPADTVITGCEAIASRSAEMSPVSSAPRCTPPIPPVANTDTPAAAAIATDADTVVAPNSQRWPTATATSRSAALRAGPRIRSCSSSVKPQSDDPVEDRGDRRHSPTCPHGRDAPIERLTIVG